MPPVCRVCNDARRAAIDSDFLGGRSVPKISKEYEIPLTNLYRHFKQHQGTKPKEPRVGSLAAAPTLQALEDRDRDLEMVFRMSLARGHTAAAVTATRERIRIALEVAQIRGEIVDRPKVVQHVSVDSSTAERMLNSYLRHKQLTGAIDGE